MISSEDPRHVAIINAVPGDVIVLQTMTSGNVPVFTRPVWEYERASWVRPGIRSLVISQGSAIEHRGWVMVMAHNVLGWINFYSVGAVEKP